MDPFLNAPSTPRKQKPVDRFILQRPGTNLEKAFSVASSLKSPQKQLGNAFEDPVDIKAKETRYAREKYATVLKSEMFGTSPSSSSSNLNLNSSSQLNTPYDSPERVSPMRSSSVMSLPTSPRRKRDIPTSNSGILKAQMPRLIWSETDLSDISSGGGSAAAGGGGLGSSLRPESKDLLLRAKQKPRHIKTSPYKVLDAPQLADDFYTNLVEWGPTNRLAVGLGHHVYVWDAETSAVADVANLASDDMVCSVTWLGGGDHIAVGTSSGRTQIYDIETCQRLRNMVGHAERVSTLAANDHILTSGSRDQTLAHRDVRLKSPYIARMQAHYGEVCGLKWNADTQQLASGGNDNKLRIWSGLLEEPLYTFEEHTSAVKGISWSPHQRGLLASGGGYRDRKIWFWNTNTGQPLSSTDSGSQVCNLAWSPHFKELISSQGNDNNDIVVWKYPTMQPMTRLQGHSSRVLHLSLSPDGSGLATGAGDETLRLWSMFDAEAEVADVSVVETYQQLR